MLRPSLINPSPTVFPVKPERKDTGARVPDITDCLDKSDIFEVIRDIKDPEHPYTLEQLSVVREDLIKVRYNARRVCTIEIEFTPTVPHCSLATLIGLCLRVKLERELAQKCKIDIFVAPGSHATEKEVNKQINDKERIQAALENPYLKPLIEECIKEREG